MWRNYDIHPNSKLLLSSSRLICCVTSWKKFSALMYTVIQILLKIMVNSLCATSIKLWVSDSQNQIERNHKVLKEKQLFLWRHSCAAFIREDTAKFKNQNKLVGYRLPNADWSTAQMTENQGHRYDWFHIFFTVLNVAI